MKKVLLFSAAILALSSCSNTDVLEEGNIQQTNAIGFQTLVNKESRALSNGSFNDFYVYGSYYKSGNENNKIAIFNGERVTKGGTQQDTETGTNTGWGYVGTRYWINGAMYKFYGYSCENREVGKVTVNGNDVTTRANYIDGEFNLVDYISDKNHQHDLVFASSNLIEGKETGNQPVSFSFKHILSKLRVNFVNKYPAGYTLTISNVKVSNIRNKGKFYGSIDTPSWGNETEVDREGTTPELGLKFGDNASVELRNVEGGDQINAQTGWGYVIPFAYKSANVDIVFDLKVVGPLGGDPIIDRRIAGQWRPTWEQSIGYSYKVTLTGGESGLEPIKFGVEPWDADDGWGSADGQEITFSPAEAGN